MDNLFKERNDIVRHDDSENNISTPVDNLRTINFIQGDIICGKVGRYPWWPCMVCDPPNNENYVHDSSNQVFVKYFGRGNEVSWLKSGSILDIQSRCELEKYVFNNFKKPNKKPSNRLSDDIENAWEEVERAVSMSHEERLETFGIDYNILKNKLKASNKNRKYKPQVKPKKVDDNPQSKPRRSEKPPIKYAFEELDLPFDYIHSHHKCCRYCLVKDKTTISCSLNCGYNFHVKCVKELKEHLKKDTEDDGRCLECFLTFRLCIACASEIKSHEERVLCSVPSCHILYHRSCLEEEPRSEMTRRTLSNEIICPRHLCHRCELIDHNPKFQCGKLVTCLMCPATYHSGDWCVPAGSFELSKTEIICPKHLQDEVQVSRYLPPFVARVASDLQSDIYGVDMRNISERLTLPPMKANQKFVNVNWCFSCGIEGKLICCEICPAAYHFDCAKITTAPHHFFCVGCRSGKYHNYGEIVWIKYGCYRWWPGQIMHHENVPDNIASLAHHYGQFVVQFFGTQEYVWINHDHVFSFEAGDKNNLKRPSSTKTFEKNFILALKEAEKGLTERDLIWATSSSRGVSKSKVYKHIKTNKPFGDVKIHKPQDILDFQKCDCTYLSNSDCGFGSDCINIQLKYECHQNLCSMKERCKNQNFVKRNYPKQEIFNSGRCGWGLKTNEAIKKHQFVNEYIGEIIDNSEAERRKEWAKENNITDFYFMELDCNRIIDAREYSNKSRFMNHSCNPNLFAEKWIVMNDHRIGLFALRDIGPGEELTFNYNLYTKSPNRLPCLCGAINCSGFLGEQPKKIETNTNRIKKEKSVAVKRNTSKGKRPSVTRRKYDKDAAESVSKGSMTNSISTVSLCTTIKPMERLCFCCSEECSELTDMSCGMEMCSKIFHRGCLGLPLDHDDEFWVCPWHLCDECGIFSTHYCTLCPMSLCDEHFSIDRFRQMNPTNDGVCYEHDYDASL